MDTEAVQPQEAPLTVNEQVIVMSSHETIRVLEVGVDAPLPAEEDRKAPGMPPGEVARGSPGETTPPGTEDIPPSTQSSCSVETAGKAKVATGASPSTVSPLGTFGHSTSQQPQTVATPLAVQATPQVLTQENLATVVTGVMVPAGTVTQPLLIPISIAGQVAGQQGLAVWTFPTATVAALPGLTAPSPTGGIFKQPIANLQGKPTPPPPHHGCSSASQPPRFIILLLPLLFPRPSPWCDSICAQSRLPFSCRSEMGRNLRKGGLVCGKKVIGTLPWVVNSPGMAATSPVPAALPAQNLQVQTVTPQLLLNAQGQVIATLASSTIPAATIKKTATPDPPAKTEVQPIQPAPALSQPTVVVANPAPVAKASPAPVPITCSETPTVSQLVSSESRGGAEEDGINLEEIREFAKNFKIRRLSLGLTQTQVGQALTATEGPAYSQSAICRFEKLDITPKSAQKLKPVLEKWLSEAELRNREGQQNLMEFVGGEPSKKRKRRTSFTPQAIEALNAYFEKNALPTGQEITDIAKELNYDREVVRVWFCNRRQTLKNTSKLNVFQIP
ncbi:PREDICTED: POU domain, class 6, transcription factor 1 [Calidris pugnax]|uniref:POU domain, class 6, transcription factor 1 n=1 Tax=Calidris pugnax TaxID=198806 RepID=UPI00071C4265|nr:PREDICTED: POU domain, class 6, transcription factor 1 [Calidris pugnax]